MDEEPEVEPISLYFWPTPNGQKIAIMLEETGEPYVVHYVDINAGAQFDPAFLAISPNNKMPAIVDHDGPDGNPLAIFESGAILKYLARKYECLYPTSERQQAQVDQWLFWQVGGLGPMSGQALHFRKYAKEKVPYGIDRYTAEVTRLYGVLEKQLTGRDYLAGDYSIADIACYPWILRAPDVGQDLTRYPAISAWVKRIGERPEVMRGMSLGQDPASRVNVA